MFPRRHVSPPRLDRPGCRRRGPPAPAVAAPAVAAAAAVAAPAVAAAAAVAGAVDGLQRPSATVWAGGPSGVRWVAMIPRSLVGPIWAFVGYLPGARCPAIRSGDNHVSGGDGCLIH